MPVLSQPGRGPRCTEVCAASDALVCTEQLACAAATAAHMHPVRSAVHVRVRAWQTGGCLSKPLQAAWRVVN